MNVIRESYLSVTDFDFYRSVARQSLWRSSLYFLFWVTLSTVFTTVVFLVKKYPSINETAEWIMRNLPPMEVRQGKLYAPIAEPLHMDRQNPELHIVVDPSDTVLRTGKSGGLEVVFNSNRIFYRYQGRENAHVFRKEDNFPINRKTLEYSYTLLKLLAVPAGMFLYWPVNWLLKVFQLLFLVLGGLLVGAGPLKQLKWTHWLNIAIYALTPAILIGMIFEPTTVKMSIAWLFYISTAMLYTLMAAQRCVTEKK